MHQQLHQWMLDWVNTTVYLPDGLLAKAWQWQGYDEGVRFAFFRVLEELRWMESVVIQQQHNQGQGYGAVHPILTAHHQAYWDLRVLFSGLDDKVFDQSPGEEDWSLRDILYHILEVEWAFYGVVRYAFQLAGTKPEWQLGLLPRDFMNSHFEEEGHFHESVFNGDFRTMFGFYDQLHTRILEDLKDLPDAKLAEMVAFWEPQPMPARFRLIRFESHIRQHSIQAQKNLDQFGIKSSEIKQLLRAAAQSFASLEARLIFLPINNTDLITRRFAQLQQYTDVIREAAAK